MTTNASPRAAAESVASDAIPAPLMAESASARAETLVSPAESLTAPASSRPSIPLRDIILGGQDGLVNVLGLSLGMAAATGDTRVVITAGLAAMLAESIAMAGVAYTSAGAERERTQLVAATVLGGIHARSEARHRGAVADAEARGADAGVIRAALVDEAAAWRDEVESVRRDLAPMSETRPAAAAAIVGLSTLSGSAIPLIPFLFLPVAVAPWAALALATAVLIAVGLYRARISGGRRYRAAAQMAVIGLLSALAGYAIGVLLRAPGA
jgi:VIT1/CCC1 family predicted Fe2+/Mn2+ transporter